LVVTVDPEGWELHSSKMPAWRAWLHKVIDLQQGAGLDSRWGGFPQLRPGHGELYFLGTRQEAYDTLITDLEAWSSNLSAGEHIRLWATQTDSYYASGGPSGGYNEFETDPGSHSEWDVDAVLIPRAYVVDQGAVMKSTLDGLIDAGLLYMFYQLGGQVANVPEDATAIHPAMRTAQFSFATSHYGAKLLRDAIPGSETCFNHHGQGNRTLESLFGSNLRRLQEVKASYDPDSRFNCYHCVGWQDPGDKDFSSCASATTTEDIFLAGAWACGPAFMILLIVVMVQH